MIHDPMDLSEKKKIIGQHPCFNKLTSEELEKFASLFFEKTIPEKTIIFEEGDLIDSIYFIVKGQVEVLKGPIPLAILGPGEAIGLNETGLYSKTERRTATLKTNTDCVLLRLDIAAFYEFLQSEPHLNSILKENTEIILRMNLIKHAAPFAKLTIENIRLLAREVRSITISAGNTIFCKGDPGDYCYLLHVGKIEIFDEENRIAILKPPMIFGEAALLMGSSRNASARALKDCKLLVLKRDTLLKLTKQEGHVADALISLLKTRARPRGFPHIISHVHETNTQETLITLEDTQKNNYYRLTKEGWFIWKNLDGKHTLRDLTIAFYNEFGVFDPKMLSLFILDLTENGFIEKLYPISTDQTKNKLLKWIKKIRQLLEISYTFNNVDNWLSRSYQYFFKWFFTLPAQILFMIIIFLGISTFAFGFHQNVELLYHTKHTGWLVIIAFSISMATLILHELAHAYATKAFCRKVHHFGIGWFWIGPVAFCDTSDMWLANKEDRMIVDVAGIIIDLVIAGITAIAAFFLINHPFLSITLWLIALSNYLSVFTNLSPLIELDGYYLLMDFFGKENLRQSAMIWLIEDFPHLWRRPDLLLQYKAEIAYWVLSIGYLILALIIPYAVMSILLYGIFGLKKPYLSLLGPILVIFLSSISIWEEIQRTRAHR